MQMKNATNSMRRTPSIKSNMSGMSKETAQNKGALADKLDRSTFAACTALAEKLDRSTSVTHTSEFTCSPTRENEDTPLVIMNASLASPPLQNRRSKKTGASLLRKGNSEREASAGQLLSASAASSTWLPTDNIWDPELAESFANQVEAEKRQSQKLTEKAFPLASSSISEELKAATSSSCKLSKKHKKSNLAGDFLPKKGTVDSKPRSEKPSKHIRKTMRHSKSERSVTRDSPTSNNSKDHTLSPREAFRAFLLQDRVTQSRRDIVKSPLTPENKDRKRKTKRAKSSTRTSSKDHSAASRVHQNQPTPNTSVEVSSNRSRGLKHKHAPMSMIKTPRDQSPKVITPSPSLHSVFEWTRSPMSTTELKEESPVSRREALHRTPSSQGLIERRKLMRKAHSTSDVHLYHLTPEWPSPRRNAKLHSLFYDLSVRRQRSDRASTTGVPMISAKDMLRIMEPCSRREILTAQGLELEPPLCREDCIFNYGDVFDTISLASSKNN